MAEREIMIRNKLGLHARASAKLAAEASKYGADIQLCRDEIAVNAKSIMGIMMLAASKGTPLTLRADGDDADAALEAIAGLVDNHFGEGE